jgi:flagellar biosynthesis protein FlhG
MDIMDQAENLRRMAGERSRASVLDPDEGSVSEETVDETSYSAPFEEAPARTRVISVTSGKGGVGKSTLSVNLGIAIGRLGKRVLLLDGDLGLANVNVLMGIIPEHNIYEVMKGKKKIRDIIISTSFGIDIIAGANGISQLANLSDTARETFLEQLGGLTGYDVLLIDTGAGVGANVLGLVMPADEIVVVTTPEPTAITDAYGMIKSIVANGQEKIIKLIVNRVPSAIEAKRVSDRLASISAQFLKTEIDCIGFVFEENLVQKSIRSQRPHVVQYPGSKSSACMNHIAARLMNTNVKDEPDGIMAFFRRVMGFGEEKNVGAL